MYFNVNYISGLNLYKKALYEEAKIKFRKALFHKRNHAQCSFKLGMCYFKLEQWKKARFYIEKAVCLDSSKTGWKKQLEQSKRHLLIPKQKIFKEENLTLEQKISVNPNDAKLYRELASNLQKQGLWWQEIEALKKAVSLDDTKADWYYRLGQSLEIMNRYSEATQNYIKAIELKKDKADAEWYYRAGYCYETKGHDGVPNLQKAKEYYKKAIEKDTKLKAKEFGIGVFHEIFHKEQARDLILELYLEELKKFHLNTDLLFNISKIYEEKNNLEEAKKYLSLAISLDFNQIYWHYKYADILYRLSDYENSIKSFDYIIETRDRHTPFWYHRNALNYVALREYKKACESFINTNGDYIEKLKNILKKEAQECQAKFFISIEELKRNSHIKQITDKVAIEEDKNLYQNKFQLIQNEIEVLNTLISLDNTNKDLYFKLSLSHEELGDYIKAIEYCKDASCLGYKNTNEINYHIGYCLYRLEKYEEAIEYFKNITYTDGFENRIKKETTFEVINLSFSENIYKFILTFKNNSKINPEINISSIILKHRVRIGNETQEVEFIPDIKKFGNNTYLSFEIDMKNLDIELHFWDLFAKLIARDKVYGDVEVIVPISRYSQYIINDVDENVQNYIYMDEENIFFPYKTVGGRKIAFLKRPKTLYDDPIYFEREKQALEEYKANKEEWDSKKAWLIYEKYSQTAQDNGYYFFKYASQKRENVYYIIEKDSPDMKNLVGYEDKVVEFMSVEHMKLMLSAQMMISSETRGHSYAWRRVYNKFKEQVLNKPYVFLQHGVIALKKIDNELSKNKLKASKFIVSNSQEKDIIKNNFAYDENDILISGLSRWQNLIDKSNDFNEIFLMPTWRTWLEDMSDEDFLNTDYFNSYKNLLTSKTLEKFLEDNNIVLNFYLHPKIITHLDKFSNNSKNVKLVDFGEISVRELLMRSKILITDYSSVAWDFTYLAKPVLFYHFDVEKYEELQGSYIDLKTEIPGVASYSEDELLESIITVYKNYNIEKENAKKYKDIYFNEISDNPNEVIFNEIIKLGEK